ncbi:MAG: Bax inhibitor-1 family protein, partial [Firmicutes bacterium]|nr:Bax inhibitor-1 family protein [Bacillota bacterium]
MVSAGSSVVSTVTDVGGSVISTVMNTFLGLIVAELVLVFVLAANIMRMSFLTATLMFIAYSVVNGATLSTIFLVYDLGSIGLTFLVTAGMFGAMSLYGFVTGRDLSSWG